MFRRYSPIDPAALPGVRPGLLPVRLEPQLATPARRPPAGAEWLHEIKYDGYRMTISVRGEARIWTRNGFDWTHRLPRLAAALGDLGLHAAALDAELVCLSGDGRSDFEALQACVTGGRGRLCLYLFDLIHLDGWDLARVPLIERKEALRRLLEDRTDRDTSCLRFSDHIAGSGAAVFDLACRAGLEGIVSKRAGSRYRPGKRSPDWLKTKNPAYHHEFAGPWPKRRAAH